MDDTNGRGSRSGRSEVGAEDEANVDEPEDGTERNIEARIKRENEAGMRRKGRVDQADADKEEAEEVDRKVEQLPM